MARAIPWVIVLAGGDGVRLREFTRDALGRPAPKQFCRFGTDKSLFSWTLGRARALSRPDRIVPVVAEGHRAWWTAELGDWPAGRAVLQPENRGTAVAILIALLRIVTWDRDAVVVLLPSDHFVDDEPVLRNSLRAAAADAEREKSRLTLLGMAPETSDPDYGWIECATEGRFEPALVRRFVEKPSAAEAAKLRAQGALWNSFLMAGRAAVFLGLYRDLQPELWAACARHLFAPGREREDLASLYASLDSRDFSRDLLQRADGRLRVLRVPPCGWADLGTPERMASWTDRHRARTQRRAIVPFTGRGLQIASAC